MPNSQISLRLASPWSRILATLIDNLINSFVFIIISFPFGVASVLFQIGSSGNEDLSSLKDLQSVINSGTNLITGLLSLAIWIVAFIVVPIYLWKGQTIGKRLLNIKIVKLSGGQVDQADILKRYSIPLLLNSVALIPFLGVLTCCLLPIATLVNLFMLFSDDKRQTLFDKVAKTVVVEAN